MAKRNKSYYTKSEITSDLYTNGKQWQLENGTEYIGLYHRYSTGETYTGANWDSNKSLRLFRYIDTENIPPDIITYRQLNKIKTSYKTPVYKPMVPTTIDIANTYYTRYFLQRYDEYIIEINDLQFTDWNNGKIDNSLYSGHTLKWYISGPIEDIPDTITTLGVKTKNRNQLIELEKTLPGISLKIKSLTENYTDSIFIVPKDINE